MTDGTILIPMRLTSDMRAASLVTTIHVGARIGSLIFLAAFSPLQAESVTLRPAADTTLFELNPTNNLGGVATLVSGTTAGEFGGGLQPPGKSRALIRFELAGQVPGSVIITSATFRVRVVKVASIGGVASTFGLHRVLQTWGEGNKGAGTTIGSAATVGEATWQDRLYPATQWGAPGGASGADYVAEPSFGSRESANSPTLLLEYTTQVAPQSPLMSQMAVAGNRMTFQFNAQARVPYTVQFKDSLAAAAWSSLTNVLPQPVDTNVVLSDPILGGQRCYRITSP